MNKYEQLIEFIINENEEAAKEIFHQIVVEKSRDIYESLMDEEMGGNQAQSFVQDITNQDEAAQEHGLGEDDEEAGEIELDGGDMDDEETFGGEEGEHAEHEDIEGKIDELSAQLEELKAMLGAEEAGEHEHGMSGSGEHSEFDMDDAGIEGGDEEQGFGESSNPFAKSGSGSASGSGKSGSGKSGSGMMEAAKASGSGMSGSGSASGSGKSGSGVKESRKLSDVEIMKEYVNKIGEVYKQEPATGEGKTVGAGGDQPTVNKDGVVRKQGPKFDGETADNLVRGDKNEDPDGKAIPKPKNEYSKGETQQPLATKDGGYKNKIGGNTPWNKNLGKVGADKKESETGKTVGAGSDKPALNKKSEIGGKVR